MKILALHNFYQRPGGEDYVFRAETELFEREGHVVVRHVRHNDAIRSGWVTGISTTWNHASFRHIREIARSEKPDVACFYNTFPLISPAAYYAVRGEGIPVIQRISNFRLLCPGGNLVRDGKVCEDCVTEDSLLPSISHACYRGSKLATAAVATMLASHRGLKTWQNAVDLYVAPSEFVRQKVVLSGRFHSEIVVRPHFLANDPGVGEGLGEYALYVGRLSEEKGIATLRDAWAQLSGIPLIVAGDGPLNTVKWSQNVQWIGHQNEDRIYELIRNARVLVVPSICFEIGPLTILEAFGCGTPVIASDLGSMAERVEHMRTGLLFRPGDPKDLAEKVRWAWGHPEQLRGMRSAARQEYESKYAACCGYKMLMNTNEMAMEIAGRRRRDAGSE